MLCAGTLKLQFVCLPVPHKNSNCWLEVPSNPEKNMKAAEDFLLLLIHAHVIVAADKLFEYYFGGDSLTSVAKSIVNTHLLAPSIYNNG